MGEWADFLKTSAPVSLINTFPVSLILAGSISLDSTFKVPHSHSLFLDLNSLHCPFKECRVEERRFCPYPVFPQRPIKPYL
jgi:hypothetical protein